MRGLAILVCIGTAVNARAELLLYEPFDYSAGTMLQGADGGAGFDGPWVDNGSAGVLGSPPTGGHTVQADDSSLGNLWTGIPQNGMPNLGFFCMGERRDDNSGSRPIDSAVTATFVDGTVTWMSYVSGHTNNGGQNDNHHKPNLAIGQGPLQDNRADNAAGQAIGGGAHKNQNAGGVLSATYWDDEDNNGIFEEHRSFTLGSSLPRIIPQQLMVMKIEWGADKDTVAFNVFDIGTGGGYVAPTEGAFDATAISITSVNNLDQSTFDTLSFHGSRMNIDEIRLGTTFDAVVNGTETGGGGRPSFAITSIIHLGNAIAIEFVHRYFPARQQARGQALYSSLSFGAGGALGSVASGWLWAAHGATVTFSAAGAMALLGACVVWRAR